MVLNQWYEEHLGLTLPICSPMFKCTILGHLLMLYKMHCIVRLSSYYSVHFIHVCQYLISNICKPGGNWGWNDCIN